MEALKPRKGRLKEFMFNSFGIGAEKHNMRFCGANGRRRKAWEHEKNVNIIK